MNTIMAIPLEDATTLNKNMILNVTICGLQQNLTIFAVTARGEPMMSKEKSIEATEIFTILSETINGANFDDLCDAAHRIVHIAGYHKQREGEWIKIFRYSRNWDSFYDLTCPGCGALFKHIPESDISSRYKYCSVCGLKMKGGAE
jgi:hypothetical protein